MPHRMPISVDDVERFMTAKNALRACGACGVLAGYETFDEVAMAKRYAILRFQFPGYETVGMEASEIVVVECRNCAAVRVHNRKTIADWVHANPAPSSSRHS